MISVRQRILLTDGSFGVGTVAIGIIDAFTNKLIWLEWICLLLALLIFIVPKVVLKKNKKEQWDEYTNSNYYQAMKYTIGAIGLIVCVLGVIMGITGETFIINSAICYLILGAIFILQCFFFILIDNGIIKRKR